MQHKGASIIAGSGAVARHDRLTVVAGGSVIQGSDELGQSALRMIDELDSAGDWSFEAVAAALHQLVLAEDPRGVAAVLRDDDGEVLLFAFDRASAQGGETTATGDGRSGWKTEVASDSAIQLRLDNVPFKAADTNIELRAGLVPGAGALLTALPFREPPITAPPFTEPVPTRAEPVLNQPGSTGQPHTSRAVPPPPSGPSTRSALPPNYLPAPPPVHTNKVDPSLLPPPPSEWQPGPSPSGPAGDRLPPPPRGPATNLAAPSPRVPMPEPSSDTEAPSGPPTKDSWDA